MPGIALLLLRGVFGLALLMQGGACVSGSDPGMMWFAGLFGLAAGILFVLGFLTPIAGIVVALYAISIRMNALPDCNRPLVDSGMALAFQGAILLAVLLLGPGAYSVDARVFGRREIIIPPNSKPRH